MINARELKPVLTSETAQLSTGASLFYQQVGTADELVVFIHAVGCDHSSWVAQMQALASRYTCVSVDLRGHGRSKTPSNSPSEVSIQTFADDVGALIDHLGFARAHLVGLSMGAVVALQLFQDRKDCVQSLALCNTWSYHPEGPARIQFMEDQLKKMSLPQSSAQLIPGLFAPGTAKKIIDDAVQVEQSKDPDVFMNSWRSMFKVDFRGLLKSIDVPVLLLGGAEDQITPTEPLLTEMFEHIPMAKLVDLANTGHFSNLNSPDAFNIELQIHVNRARSNKSQKVKAVAPRTELMPAETTAEALMYLLNRRGVDCFFSNSGTDFTPIIDALARYESDPQFTMKVVAAPHENTAVAMAHGYFLLSGRPQVTMAHVNVGTANMGLGMINAARARIPMLVMSGKTPWFEGGIAGCRTNFVQWGQDTFDQAAYFREFTKWDYELKSPHNLEATVDRSFAIAQSDPCGPVYLSLPKEPLCQKIQFNEISSPARQQPSFAGAPDHTSVTRAADLIARAKNPLIITSEIGRFRSGPEHLVQLATEFSIPVIEHGKRNFFNFPTEHPMHLGFSPSPYVEAADLIIAVECHVPWIPAQSQIQTVPTMIQIGLDPLFSRLPMRSFPVDVSITGDPATCLRDLHAKLLEHKESRENTDASSAASTDFEKHVQLRAEKISLEHANLFQKVRENAYSDQSKTKITKRFLSNCIGKVVTDNVIIFNEYDLDPFQVPRRLTDSWFENSVASGLGWSLGAALGGKLASPDQTIMVTMGDGSYMFNTPLSAHFVAASYNLPIVIVVFNDSAWSTIKMSTKGSHKDGWAVKNDNFALCDFDINVKFEKLAESCGGIGLVVDEPSSLLETLRKALALVREEQKHVLVNVICERDG